MSTHKFQIAIPTDNEGFLGRECKECKKYFKIKPGTGLDTTYCHCPYCEYEGNQNTFFTVDQLEYAKSKAKQEIFDKLVDPMFRKFTHSMNSISSKSNGLFKMTIKASYSKPFFPIRHYDELELETKVTCSSCFLQFSIYGVFSRCPDCTELNAYTIFTSSIEVCRKQIALFSEFATDRDVVTANLKFVLANAISSFDGFGKELRRKLPSKFPAKPKNLFQNIIELDKALQANFSFSLSQTLGNYEHVKEMFQVRHIYEHNMGVIDSDFIQKVPTRKEMLGRKYVLELSNIEEFLIELESLAKLIELNFRPHHA